MLARSVDVLRNGQLLALIAARTTWVLLTTPTTTEPCFTASCAYSTWKIRPWGELQAAVSGALMVVVAVGRSVQCDGIVVVVIAEHGGELRMDGRERGWRATAKCSRIGRG